MIGVESIKLYDNSNADEITLFFNSDKHFFRFPDSMIASKWRTEINNAIQDQSMFPSLSSHLTSLSLSLSLSFSFFLQVHGVGGLTFSNSFRHP